MRRSVSAVLGAGVVALLCLPTAAATAGSALRSARPGAVVGRWEVRAPLPANREEVAYVRSGSLLYLAVKDAHYAYDPQADTWRTLRPLPVELDHIQAAGMGGKVYYIGGNVSFYGASVSTVYIYDPATDSFSNGRPMPAGRDRGAGGVIVRNGRICIVGGRYKSATVQISRPFVDCYTPASDTWRRLPDMPRGRDHLSAALINNKIYVTGGRVNPQRPFGATDVYDFTTSRWSTGLAPMPTPRGGAATAVFGTQMVVIGGEGAGLAYDTVEAYDTVANTWTRLEPMPTARHGIQAAMWNGGAYVAGGGLTMGGGAATSAHEVLFVGPSAGATGRRSGS